MKKSYKTDGEETCTLLDNIAVIESAGRTRSHALEGYAKNGADHPPEFRTIWAEYWITLKSIKPCQCSTCKADRVLREISGDDYKDFQDEIAHVGWENARAFQYRS